MSAPLDPADVFAFRVDDDIRRAEGLPEALRRATHAVALVNSVLSVAPASPQPS